MSQYYYLVAGLPDITLDDAKLPVSYVDYMEELMQALSSADKDLLAFFRMPYENRNLLAWLADKEAVLHPLGRLTADDFDEQLQLIDYEEQAPLPGIPPYFLTFLRERRDNQLPIGGEENRLTTLFYDYTQTCSNAFVREWFQFELHLNNVQTALNCRKHGLDMDPQLVGDNEVNQALRTSTARDFNVASIFPEVEHLIRIFEEDNLLEREKKTDRLKWNRMDELCSDAYFSIEPLLAYLLKLQSLERWMQLDAATGEACFRELIQSMKEMANHQKV